MQYFEIFGITLMDLLRNNRSKQMNEYSTIYIDTIFYCKDFRGFDLTR